MAINYPESRKEILSAAQADVQGELQNSNPFLARSLILAILIALSGRMFDFYNQLRQLELLLTPFGSLFSRTWGAYKNIFPLASSMADGPLNFLGNIGGTVGSGTIVNASDGKKYETTAGGIIAADVLSVSQITRSGSIATVVTDDPHNYGTGMEPTIAGAVQTEYNITAEIVVIDDVTFTYEVSGTPVSPATGTITSTINRVVLNTESQEAGADQNQENGATLTLATPIPNVNSAAIVGGGGLDGGTDEESTEAYNDRVQENYANPTAMFNEAAITAKAKEVPGVTRVWVFETTPDVGDVTVYFVRDNDAGSIFPSAGEVTDVKDAIMTIAPSNTNESLVFVDDPALQDLPVNFNFGAISPDTPEMRSAVTVSLTELFREDVTVGVDVTRDSYRSAIFNTVDPETGQKIQSFTLTTPTGDVVVASDELATLGTVTFT